MHPYTLGNRNILEYRFRREDGRDPLFKMTVCNLMKVSVMFSHIAYKTSFSYNTFHVYIYATYQMRELST